MFLSDIVLKPPQSYQLFIQHLTCAAHRTMCTLSHLILRATYESGTIIICILSIGSYGSERLSNLPNITLW